MVSLHAVGVERTTKQLTTTASIIAARRGHHAPQAVHRVLRNCNLDEACFRWMVAYLEKELECEEQ